MKTLVQKCDQLTTTNKKKTGLQDVFSNYEAFISELLKNLEKCSLCATDI